MVSETPSNEGTGAVLSFAKQDDVIESINGLRSDQWLVVDFDQTLFSSNSSQEFIRMVKPYVLGTLVYKTIDLLRPWDWFGKTENRHMRRDSFHICAITIFFPWTWIVWNMHAKKMANAWTNEPLANSIRNRDSKRNILCSQGFGPIIRPVLSRMELPFEKTDTCRFLFGFVDRCRKKSDRVRGIIGPEALRNSTFVTDSLDDEDLLNTCKLPLLFKWPLPKVLHITSHYIPILYLAKHKLSGLGRILREVVYVDVLLLIFAFSWISPFPVVHSIGISCFFIAFLLVYEMGYMANDEVAAEFEKDPIVIPDFEKSRDRINYVEPWFWAALFSFIGGGFITQINILETSGLTQRDLFLQWPTLVSSYGDAISTVRPLLLTALWLFVLLTMRVVYRVYNRTDKMTRTWLYPILQYYKTFAFILISPVNFVGAIALISQVAGRSFAYFLYRWGRKDWPGDELYMFRFLLFFGGLLIITPNLGTSHESVFTLQTAVLAIWISSRAVKPILGVFQNSKHVKDDTWSLNEE